MASDSSLRGPKHVTIQILVVWSGPVMGAQQAHFPMGAWAHSMLLAALLFLFFCSGFCREYSCFFPSCKCWTLFDCDLVISSCNIWCHDPHLFLFVVLFSCFHASYQLSSYPCKVIKHSSSLIQSIYPLLSVTPCLLFLSFAPFLKSYPSSLFLPSCVYDLLVSFSFLSPPHCSISSYYQLHLFSSLIAFPPSLSLSHTQTHTSCFIEYAYT